MEKSKVKRSPVPPANVYTNLNKFETLCDKNKCKFRTKCKICIIIGTSLRCVKFTFIFLIIFTFKFSPEKGKAIVFTKQIINYNYT